MYVVGRCMVLCQVVGHDRYASVGWLLARLVGRSLGHVQSAGVPSVRSDAGSSAVCAGGSGAAAAPASCGSRAALLSRWNSRRGTSSSSGTAGVFAMAILSSNRATARGARVLVVSLWRVRQ